MITEASAGVSISSLEEDIQMLCMCGFLYVCVGWGGEVLSVDLLSTLVCPAQRGGKVKALSGLGREFSALQYD